MTVGPVELVGGRRGQEGVGAFLHPNIDTQGIAADQPTRGVQQVDVTGTLPPLRIEGSLNAQRSMMARVHQAGDIGTGSKNQIQGGLPAAPGIEAMAGVRGRCGVQGGLESGHGRLVIQRV